jgi:hypothetical protein
MLKYLFQMLLATAALASCLSAAITVTFTPSVPSPQPVGTTIIWTASATDTDAGAFDYSFSVSNNGGAFQTFQDYDVSNVYAWTPSLRESSFTVKVIARNMSTVQTATVTAPFTITAIVPVAGPPAITAAANPLVALYSAPGCPTGSFVRVKFTNGTTLQRTAALACSPTATTNLYVAGMLPSTTYQMNYEVVTGSTVTSGPVLPFTTGVIDPTVNFPPISIPLTGFTDTKQQVLLLNAQDYTPPSLYFPFATDLTGRVIWYYPQLGVPQQQSPYDMRPAAGGTILLLINNPNTPNLDQQIFREIDLAGNTIRQTSATHISQQLTGQGKYPIISFTHDAIRLTNGHTILLGSQEQIYPAGTQGATAPVDILGDVIIDLNANLQVVWSWSAYDYLDINRPATLGETCTAHEYGCPPIHLAPVANDWLHCNSINYVPADGSLLLSCRNQDWVFKIDYGNETGTNDVLWTLGLGGSFTMTGTADPYPWFSHQHDVEFVPGSTTQITVFDDGNTRVSQNPGEDSRGQALTIDQAALTASLLLNADMGVYAVACGSAQLLDNGNYHFDTGWVPQTVGSPQAQSVEVTPGGSIIYSLNDTTVTYRTYRMSTLYSIP